MSALLLATADDWLGLGLGVGLLAFLVVVLLRPERF